MKTVFIQRLLPASLFAISLCLGAVQGNAQVPAAAGQKYTGPRTPDGKPNLNGIWQAMSPAHWNLEAHSAEEGIPAGQSVVDGGTIPYKPEALAKRKEHMANRAKLDPMLKCFLPGVPRAMYVPFPFQITQTPKYFVLNHEYQHATRIIYTDGSEHAPPNDFWMGDSRGKWEGDTLVVDVTHFNDRTWFDLAGNYHSDALHVIERFTPLEAGHVMHYEATIEDPKVFTRPWKINLPLYRRAEKNIQLLDYDCVDFFWKERINKPSR
jgi:hypothetical protein